MERIRRHLAWHLANRTNHKTENRACIVALPLLALIFLSQTTWSQTAAPVTSDQSSQVARASDRHHRWALSTDCTDSVVDDLLTEGYVLLYNRLYQFADVKYRKAIRIQPDCAEAHVGLSLVLRYMGVFKQSLEESEKALALDSLALPALWNYGELIWPWRGVLLDETLSDSTRMARSVAALNRAASLNDPTASHPLISLWIAYTTLGDTANANAQLRELGRRGYYPRLVRDYSRNLLGGLDSNAILFATGDVSVIATLSLQRTEHFRTDVTVAPISLLSIPSLARGYRDSYGLPLELSNRELDSADVVTIVRQVTELAELQGRPVYFELGVPDEIEADIGARLSAEGIVSRLMPVGADSSSNWEKIAYNLRQYRIPDSSLATDPRWESNLSPTTSNLLPLAYAYYRLFINLAEHEASRDSVDRAVGCYRQAFLVATALDDSMMKGQALASWLALRPKDMEARGLWEKFGFPNDSSGQTEEAGSY